MLYTARTFSVPRGRGTSSSYSILHRMSLAYWKATDGVGVREKIEMEVMRKYESRSRQHEALGDKTKQNKRREKIYDKSHCILWHHTNCMQIKNNRIERERVGEGKNIV